MAAEVDDTGTIADTSNDRCSVLVRIDGKEETLSFSKKCLYSYGFQCEGDMRNILDPGTEVNLCYRLSKPRNNPTILAVWIGDKPDQDTLNSDLLEAVYSQEGLVNQVLDDTNYLASGDDMLATVIINKDVVYRDGCPSSTVLSVGERIIFDALPSESALPSGAKYQATCAWTGSHPRIVDRFGLNKETTKSEKVEFLVTNVIDGIVFVIPNDVIAFVKAEVENVAIEVILFRSSFSDKRGRIQEIVEVGERIRMRLCFAIIFRGKRQWFAAKAWKDGEEIPVDDQVEVDGKLVELESLAFHSESSVKSSSVVVGRRPPSPAAIANPARFLSSPVSGAGYPSAYGNCTIPSGYPGAPPGYPASWISYSNSRMYPVNPIMYPYSPAVPIGMVGIPVGMYGYPAYVGANPSAYARLPSAAVGHPLVPASLPGNPSKAPNLHTAESIASIIHKPPIPNIDPSTGFPVVMLATPDSRFTATSRILYSDPPLTGVISTIPSKKFPTRAMISYGNIVIAATEGVIYINQRQCTEEQFVTLIASGKTVVHFESVVNWSVPKGTKKKKPTHLATCVWLGQKPTMLDIVSDMYQPDMSLLGRKDTVFFGRVKKICLPDIALVEINERESTVCVHVSAFKGKLQPKSECLSEEASIAHFIKMDQWLAFRIVSVAACPIVLTGIDVKLFEKEKQMKKARALSEQQKDGSQNDTEVSHIKSGITDDDDSCSDAECEPALNTMPSAGSNAENISSLGTVSYSEIASGAKTLSCLKNMPKTITESDAAQSGRCYQAAAFMAHPKPQGVPIRFINWSGIMHIEREDGLTIYKVERVSGFPCNLLCTPKILDFCRRFNDVLAEHDGLEVKFNAECSYEGKKKDFFFYISRIWRDSRISGIDMLCTDLARDEDPKFEQNVPLRAVVTSITQHDVAVATFDDTPIIIPFEALRLSEECPKRNHFSSVDHYLKEGHEVIVTDITTRFYFTNSGQAKSSYCHVAGSCWRAVKIGPSQWDEIKMPEVQEDPSWLDRWLCGEFSRRERVVKKGDRYYVDFVSTKIPNLKLSLDVFEHSKFFVNGESKPFDSLSNLKDCEIKIHVAHRRDPQNSDNILGEFFVKYAWIGDDPYYLTVLKDELEVPDGLVVDDWNYVAVIEDFVLPTHMICKIGVVPVVVPFPQVAQDVSEVGFQAETSLRCKSQVVVKVRETFYKGLTFLESDFARKKETIFDDSDVFIACKGEVIVPPRPEGIIRSRVTKTYACFHLCSVLPERETSLNRNERFEWFEHLKSAIRKGTKVCFSAAKDKKKADYRAYKVWLE